MAGEAGTLKPVVDPLRRAVASGHLAFCEEVARDGAQAKTLLSADQRIAIARRHAAILGEGAFERLVFAAGFPSIAPEEREIVRRMAREVRCCQLMAVCRATRRDIEMSIDTLRDARGGRLFIVAPTSEVVARSLLHCRAAEALQHTRDMIAFARDLGTNVQIDVALVDAPRADPELVADAANVFTEAGGSAMVLCDTVGACTPLQTRRLVEAVVADCDPSVLLGIHMHNDLGFGLASTVEALRGGIRYVTSSWLGLAERTGMTATEQLLVALASDPDAITARYGIRTPVWPVPPQLNDLVPLAQDIAAWLQIPLKVTDPVIGTGVNSISTGTPFCAPQHFVPYDAAQLLGVPQTIVVTQLASRRVIQAAAQARGVSLSPAQVDRLTRCVKAHCYAHNQSTVPPETFDVLLGQVCSQAGEAIAVQDGVRAADLPRTPALPLSVMEAAARHLPPSLAWFAHQELMLSAEAAQAYLRVVQTDFSTTAWHFDDPEDQRTAALWLGLGGSLFIDFASSASLPRIFAWVISPVPEAAQSALTTLKGRDGRWVPTSLVAPAERLLAWHDDTRCRLDLDVVDAVLGLGPVGLRIPVREDALPSYFIHRGIDGLSTQVVFPGRAALWAQWLETFASLTGHTFAGATSANFSGLGREVRSGGTHKDLAELQADMGYLGVPVLAGPVVVDGVSAPPEARAAAYKRLNAPFLAMPAEVRSQSRALLPTSVSLLGITDDPHRWELVRHGSLHESVLRAQLSTHGIALVHRAGDRLELSRYVGDLIAGFPLFQGLPARHIAEISQRVAPERFNAGEVIVEEGAPADRMYFVVSGRVTVERTPPVTLTAGDFFGEIALLNGGHRTASVRGAEAGVLLVLTTHVLHRLLEMFPSLAAPIRRRAQDRLTENQT